MITVTLIILGYYSIFTQKASLDFFSKDSTERSYSFWTESIIILCSVILQIHWIFFSKAKICHKLFIDIERTQQEDDDEKW